MGGFSPLEQDRLVEITWITGTPGTAGAETVTVQLDPADTGTYLRLTRAGFYDEAGSKQHDVADAPGRPRQAPRQPIVVRAADPCGTGHAAAAVLSRDAHSDC